MIRQGQLAEHARNLPGQNAKEPAPRGRLFPQVGKRSGAFAVQVGNVIARTGRTGHLERPGWRPLNGAIAQ